MPAFIWSKIAEREGKRGAVGTKVITPGKIAPYKNCLPSFNISVRRDFYTKTFF